MAIKVDHDVRFALVDFGCGCVRVVLSNAFIALAEGNAQSSHKIRAVVAADVERKHDHVFTCSKHFQRFDNQIQAHMICKIIRFEHNTQLRWGCVMQR